MKHINIETAWDDADMPHLVMVAAAAVAGMASLGRHQDVLRAARAMEVGREAFGAMSGEAQQQLLKIATVFLNVADGAATLTGFGADQDPERAAAIAEAMARQRAGDRQN